MITKVLLSPLLALQITFAQEQLIEKGHIVDKFYFGEEPIYPDMAIGTCKRCNGMIIILSLKPIHNEWKASVQDYIFGNIFERRQRPSFTSKKEWRKAFKTGEMLPCSPQ